MVCNATTGKYMCKRAWAEVQGHTQQHSSQQLHKEGIAQLGQGYESKQAAVRDEGTWQSAPDLPAWSTHRRLAAQQALLKRLRKAGRDDGDMHLARVRVVNDRAKNHVGARVSQAGHHLAHAVHLAQRQVLAARNVVHYTGRPLDRALDQRRRGGSLRAFQRASAVCAILKPHEACSRAGAWEARHGSLLSAVLAG